MTINITLGFSQEYHKNWTYAEDNSDKMETEEYRITIQAMIFQTIGRVSIQHRYRYEFRFLDHKGDQRTRYRLQLGIPLSSVKMEKGVWFSTLGNELIVDTKSEVNLSQMRSYAMLGYQITKSTNFQAGYMYITRPSAPGFHRLQFFLTQKLFFYDSI